MNGIRVLRAKRGVRQEDLAKALGITPTHLWRLETGKGAPSWELANRIAEYFGVALDELKGDEK